MPSFFQERDEVVLSILRERCMGVSSAPSSEEKIYLVGFKNRILPQSVNTRLAPDAVPGIIVPYCKQNSRC